MRQAKTFTETLFAELGTIPRKGMALIFAVNVLSGLHAFSLWWTGRDISLADLSFFAVEVTFGTVAIFVSAMLLANGRLSITGFLRFLACFVVGLLPMLIPAGLLLVAMSTGYRGPWVMPLFLFMLAGIPVAALLSAWPLAQALTQSIVSPLGVLSGTRGHRWMLVGANYAIGAINKFSPDLAAQNTVLEALLLAALQMAIGFGSMMLMTAVIVSAWRASGTVGPNAGGPRDGPHAL
ncbi:MAG: hypothetical protein EON59_08685 [Alphaproteobacteria bacterium]|nr:MAG: hypothetical protein EON59_08685 [Alphaproteobacteria bacterium]